MDEKIDYFSKIEELVLKYFDISLSDIPFPQEKLYPIYDKDLRGSGLLVGSKDALKYQNIVQGDIKNFFTNTPEGYFLIGFWGHGFNSYAFYYCRIDSRSKIFFRLPYGGAYMKNKKEAKRIRKFLPEFFDFEKKIMNDIESFKALESMGEGSYKFHHNGQEFRFDSIYNSKNKENKFDEILEKLVNNNKRPNEFNKNEKSYFGKEFEEMTPEEQEQYRKDRARKFTWEAGDLEYVGHEPLTDEEKVFVLSLKKQRDGEKATFRYKYMQSPQGLWIWDTEEKDFKKAFILMSDQTIVIKNFATIIKANPGFIGRDGKKYRAEERPDLFFSDYIPIFFDFEVDIHETDYFEDIP